MIRFRPKTSRFEAWNEENALVTSDDDPVVNSRANFVYPGENDAGPSIEERAILFLEAQDRENALVTSDDDPVVNSRANFVYPGENDAGPSIEERAILFLEAQDRVKKGPLFKRRKPRYIDDDHVGKFEGEFLSIQAVYDGRPNMTPFKPKTALIEQALETKENALVHYLGSDRSVFRPKTSRFEAWNEDETLLVHSDDGSLVRDSAEGEFLFLSTGEWLMQARTLKKSPFLFWKPKPLFRSLWNEEKALGGEMMQAKFIEERAYFIYGSPRDVVSEEEMALYFKRAQDQPLLKALTGDEDENAILEDIT
ncbi:hypothetical protein Tco_0326884 [Tanacetum coccineum]